MYSRTVSLVLIAAIVACPLWCGAGLCAGNQCSQQGKSSPADWYPAPPATKNCCMTDGPDYNDSQSDGKKPDKDADDQQCPWRSQSSCQGVCGGAVIEKSFQLDDFSYEFLLALVDAHAPVGNCLIKYQRSGFQQQCCGGAANYGRCLRTLHMSFLC